MRASLRIRYKNKTSYPIISKKYFCDVITSVLNAISILGDLGSTGVQSRIKCPGSFGQALSDDKKLCYYINQSELQGFLSLKKKSNL